MVKIADMFEVDVREADRLKGNAKLLFQIPESVILDKSLGDKRVTSLSYMLYFKSFTGNVNFSIDKMVSWTGKVPNRNRGKINQKFCEAVSLLAEDGLIELLEEPNNSACTSAVVDVDRIRDMCDKEHYATIYFDELEKILGYRNGDKLDRHMDNETVLMVFAFLRLNVRLRRNRLFEGESDVDERRSKSPDAYNCYYCDIASSLDLSERAVSKAVDVLNDLGLIYSETLPREKVNGKWVTNTTVFCNRYKRQNGYLLESGEKYYMREVGNKKKLMASCKRKCLN